jgi:hypothetical protein
MVSFDKLQGGELHSEVSPLEQQLQESPDSEAHLGKRKTILVERCDQILKMLLDYRKAYVATLEALAVANEQLIEELQEELLSIREEIPVLDKKLLKRIRVIGTLRDVYKHAQKTRVKPQMARRNDLNKIDDFLLRSERALSFLNSKIRQKSPKKSGEEHQEEPSTSSPLNASAASGNSS